MLQAFWMNMIVRLLGAIVRSMVIMAGVIIIIATVIIGALALAYAYILPIAVPISLIIGTLLLAGGGLTGVYGLILIILGLAGMALALKLWLQDRKSNIIPSQPLAQVDPQTDPKPWLSTRVKVLLNEINDPAQLKQHLIKKQEVIYILNRIDISDDEIIQTPLNQPIDAILKTALAAAQQESHQVIEMADIFIAIFTLDESLKPVLVKHDLTLEDIYNMVAWQTRLWNEIYAPSRLLSPKTLRFTGGIGKDWASGFTNYLDRFARELNIYAGGKAMERMFIAHKEKISEVERVLSRSGKNNVLLVGEEGVGKNTTILGFTRLIVNGQTLRPLRYKRILEVDVSSILSSGNAPGMLENNLIRLLNEAVRAGNVILYIPDIERLLQNGEGQSVGSVNVSDILNPYLQSSQLQLIATTTPATYQNIVAHQPTMESLFEKIEISEPDEQTTQRIIQDIAPQIEGHYGLIISYQAIRQVIKDATRYLPTMKFPQKGIDLLDEVAVDVSTRKGSKIIEPTDVNAIISQKTNIPVGQAEAGEKDKLLHLEDLMHQRVVNQVVAIKNVANALRRSRAGVGSQKKPVGSFLFLGPTGVGKTETAKALAEVYFGSETNMLRLDMSEFQEISSLESLIGDVTQSTGGRLTDGIRANPFTCVLLDEIEKAHPKILDIFLQVLDEGRLTDALGQVADFRNAIIIATSNAGGEWLRQRLGNSLQTPTPDGSKPAIDMETIEKELLDEVQKANIFRPEFLNRFDAITAFRPLTITELEQVVVFQLNILNTRLADRQITISLTPEAKTKLAQIGFDPAFGARALSRTMVELVENKVAEALLKDEIAKGGTFEITAEMIQ